MMQRTAFLLGGLLIGGGAGYYIGLTKARKEFNEQLATEVAETIAEFKETYKPEKNFEGEESEGEVNTPEPQHIDTTLPGDPTGHTGVSFFKPEGREVPKVDYAAKSKKKAQTIELPNNSIKPGVNVILNDPRIGEDPMKWERSRDKPYVISIVEFMDNGKKEDSQTLRYWSGDKVLTDDVEYRKGQDLGTYTTARIDEMVGLENLNHFGKGSQSDDILYVRNESINMDYEIELREESYAEVVLGVSPTDFDG